MIDLNQYLNPVCLDKPEVEHLAGSAAFPHNVVVNTGNMPLDDLTGYSVALLGVPDDRSSANKGAMYAPDAIRKNLYSFSRLPGKMKITDLGNLKTGTSFVRQPWSLVSVDSRLDFTAEKRPADSLNWMNDMIYRSGNRLSHLSAI